jgi:excisionase family DNA binding protein
MSSHPETEFAISKSSAEFEHMLSLPAAAKLLGVPYWSLRKAVREGLIPFYSFGTRCKRVRLSEVVAAASSLQNKPLG